ncbi:MAG: DUF4124 domain-containing protein [Gammaproteobacteria bacterium]
MYALLAILALALGSADVYRWTDADGQTHYTDRPQPGAERITITVSPPASGAATGAAQGASPRDDSEPDAAATPVGYRSLTITSPAQEQVLWNIEGQLGVAAAVQPGLQADHALRFYLDGRMEQAAPGASETRFTGVFRGEHSLRVEVVDGTGRTLVSSPETRFFVRQTSLLNPTPTVP